MKVRWHHYAVILLTLVAASYFLHSWRTSETITEREPSSASLVSRQSVENISNESHLRGASASRAPASHSSLAEQQDKNISSRSYSEQFSHNERNIASSNMVSINGKNFRWLKNVHAVKRHDEEAPAAENFPSGYTLVQAPPIQKHFGDQNSASLLVVSTGGQKRVLTGAIVVELTSSESPDPLARKHNLDITYFAPQIKTAVFQTRNSQNVLDQAKALRAEQTVKTATIELLGEGVKQQ